MRDERIVNSKQVNAGHVDIGRSDARVFRSDSARSVYEYLTLEFNTDGTACNVMNDSASQQILV
jgi:hypothetical protein